MIFWLWLLSKTGATLFLLIDNFTVVLGVYAFTISVLVTLVFLRPEKVRPSFDYFLAENVLDISLTTDFFKGMVSLTEDFLPTNVLLYTAVLLP